MLMQGVAGMEDLHLHQLLHALLDDSGSSGVIDGEGLEGCGAGTCVLQVGLVGCLKGALQLLYLPLQADLQHIVLLTAPVAQHAHPKVKLLP